MTSKLVSRKIKKSLEVFVNRNENVLLLYCQIERWKLRGRQEKITLWPSRKISLGRPQK
jgi:hypothetical protein